MCSLPPHARSWLLFASSSSRRSPPAGGRRGRRHSRSSSTCSTAAASGRHLGGHAFPAGRPAEEHSPHAARTAPAAGRPLPDRAAARPGHGQRHALGRGGLASPFPERLPLARPPAAARTHKILVIDGSFSMGVKRRRRDLLRASHARWPTRSSTSAGGDGFSVVLMAAPPRAHRARAVRGSRARSASEIDALRLPHGNADLAATLNTVDDLLQASPASSRTRGLFPHRHAAIDLDRPASRRARRGMLQKIQARGPDRSSSTSAGTGANNLAVTDLTLGDASRHAATAPPSSPPFTTTAETREHVRVELLVGKARPRPATRRSSLHGVGQSRRRCSRAGSNAGQLSPTGSRPGDYVVQVRLENDASTWTTRARSWSRSRKVPVMLVNGKPAGEPFDQATEWLRDGPEPVRRWRRSAQCRRPAQGRHEPQFADEGLGDLTPLRLRLPVRRAAVAACRGAPAGDSPAPRRRRRLLPRPAAWTSRRTTTCSIATAKGCCRARLIGMQNGRTAALQLPASTKPKPTAAAAQGLRRRPRPGQPAGAAFHASMSRPSWPPRGRRRARCCRSCPRHRPAPGCRSAAPPPGGPRCSSGDPAGRLMESAPGRARPGACSLPRTVNMRLEQLAGLAEFPAADAGTAPLRRRRPAARTGDHRSASRSKSSCTSAAAASSRRCTRPDGRDRGTAQTAGPGRRSVLRWTDTDVERHLPRRRSASIRRSISSPSMSRRPPRRSRPARAT